MRKGVTIDLWILVPFITLLLFSVAIIRSVSPGEIPQHLLYLGIAIFVWIIISSVDYRLFASFSAALYGIGLLLLLITLVFGPLTRGSIRWITLGPLTIQPSELIKPIMILVLARFAVHWKLHRAKQGIAYLLLLAVPLLLVFKQPDLGSSLVLAAAGLSIAFMGGISLRAFALILAGIVVLLPLTGSLLKPYQRERLVSFLDPYADPLGSGYSVIQSVIAVGSGQIVGRGLGHGTQSQLRFLPERHSDFIFASLAEELGIVGALVILGCYLALFVRLLRICRQANDSFGSLIAIGVFSTIFFQMTVNIGMNLGLLPVTGITLPLISSGGSSLLATSASLGLAQSVARRTRPQETIEIH